MLTLAAGLPFYALVSVAPFAILVLWVTSVVTSDAKAQEVADFLARLAPRTKAHTGVRQGRERSQRWSWPL